MNSQPIDFNDPRQRLAYYRDVLHRVRTGTRAESIDYRSPNGVSRSVTFGSIDTEALERQIANDEAVCSGVLPVNQGRRYALTAGRRTYLPPPTITII